MENREQEESSGIDGLAPMHFTERRQEHGPNRNAENEHGLSHDGEFGVDTKLIFGFICDESGGADEDDDRVEEQTGNDPPYQSEESVTCVDQVFNSEGIDMLSQMDSGCSGLVECRKVKDRDQKIFQISGYNISKKPHRQHKS